MIAPGTDTKATLYLLTFLKICPSL